MTSLIDRLRQKLSAYRIDDIKETEREYVFECKWTYASVCPSCSSLTSTFYATIGENGSVTTHCVACNKNAKKEGFMWTDELKFISKNGTVASQPFGKECRYEYTAKDTSKMWKEGVTVVTHDVTTQTCLDMNEVMASSPGTKCFLLHGNMGIGKTECLTKFLTDFHDKYPRIVTISTRRTLSCKLIGDFRRFGFQHYKFGSKEYHDLETDELTAIIKILETVTPNADLEQLGELAKKLSQTATALIEECEFTIDEICRVEGRVQTELERDDVPFYIRIINLSKSIVDACEEVVGACENKTFHQLLPSFTDKFKGIQVSRCVEDCRWKATTNNYVNLKECPKLVIQYESIHKLLGLEPFDLIIIDEIRSVASNMCCKVTNPKSNLAKNSMIFKGLLQYSKKAILMDAHVEIDNTIPYLVQSIYKPEEIRVDKYLYLRNKRHVHAISDEQEFENSIATYAQIALDAVEPSPIAICCRSRTKAEGHLATLRAKFPHLRIEMFTGKSDQSQIRQFENIAAFMASRKPHVINLTAVVTVGASLTTPFSKVFVDFRGRDGFCCPAREMIQMIGRFRNLQDTTVLVLQPKAPLYYANLQKDLAEVHEFRSEQAKRWKEIVQSETERKIPEATVTCEMEPRISVNGTLELCPTPNWFAQLAILEGAAQRQNQVFAFYSGAILTGWTVTVDEPERKIEADKKEATKPKKKQKKNHQNDQIPVMEHIFHELQKCTSVDDIESIAENAKQHVKTSDDSMTKDVCSAAYTAKLFFGSLDCMTFRQFQYAMNHHDAMWNMARWLNPSYTQRDFCEYELEKTTAFFDLASKFASVANKVALQTFVHLGLATKEDNEEKLRECANPFSDIETRTFKEIKIPLQTFTEKEEELRKIADDLCKLRGGTNRRNGT
ncbi:MAG: hypothetical protein JSS64_04005, partial [Bacteroidetes bacterium]|nr:hypothetical protein [Bacteroidota bacterium]